MHMIYFMVFDKIRSWHAMIISMDQKRAELDRGNCPACGNPGSQIYVGLTDRLFQSPGNWNMDVCSNKRCGTFWLSPRPSPDVIPEFYIDYSTHSDDQATTEIDPNPRLGLSGIFGDIVRSYLNSAYGYFNKPSFSKILLSKLIYLYPSWRDQARMRVFYAKRVENGSFLDVGCGQGGNLLTLQSLGWKAEGIDFDAAAIKIAKGRGLNVSAGDLYSKKYKSESFDLILLCHVIEHLPSPEETIGECLRILKKGGKLIIITPNGSGMGHKKFKRNWRGLETPQHLQIFNPQSLGIISRRAGFASANVFSSPSGDDYILAQSELLTKQDKIGAFDFKPEPSFTKRHLGWFKRDMLLYFLRDLHETAVAICTK